MAVMATERKEIDRLGPIGLAREALKLSWIHARFFSMIQLTLLLPLAVFSTVGTELVLYLNSQTTGSQPPAARSSLPHLTSSFGTARPLTAPFGWPMALFLLVWAVVSATGAVLVSLGSSAIIYAVGLHYTGQPVRFRDVLGAAVPRLWMRLSVTELYKVLLAGALLTAEIICSSLLVRSIHSVQPPVLLLGAAALLLTMIVGASCLNIIFTLASGISVLDIDSYGWAAVRSAPRLLKGRVVVAVLFHLLVLVPSVLYFLIQQAFQLLRVFTRDDLPWSVAAFLLCTAVSTSCTGLLWHIDAMCAAVQYVSFKAFHDEDLAESMVGAKQTAGYERIGSGTEYEASFGGQNAEPLV